MSLGKRIKDQRDSRVYSFNWTRELGDDTIATSVITISPEGLTKVGDGIVSGAKKTSVELSGGTVGTEYTIRNTITLTTSGETLSKSGLVVVRDL